MKLAMHAVVPRATIHVHSVNTIAWALGRMDPHTWPFGLRACAGNGFRKWVGACRLLERQR